MSAPLAAAVMLIRERDEQEAALDRERRSGDPVYVGFDTFRDEPADARQAVSRLALESALSPDDVATAPQAHDYVHAVGTAAIHTATSLGNVSPSPSLMYRAATAHLRHEAAERHLIIRGLVAEEVEDLRSRLGIVDKIRLRRLASERTKQGPPVHPLLFAAYSLGLDLRYHDVNDVKDEARQSGTSEMPTLTSADELIDTGQVTINDVAEYMVSGIGSQLRAETAAVASLRRLLAERFPSKLRTKPSR